MNREEEPFPRAGEESAPDAENWPAADGQPDEEAADAHGADGAEDGQSSQEHRRTPVQRMFDAAEGRGAVWVVDDAREAGVSARTARHLLRRVGWSPDHRGCWTPDQRGWDVRRELAAVDAVLDASYLVTGWTALWLRRLVTAAPEQISLVVAVEQHVKRTWPVRIHRTREFDQLMSARVEGVPTALPARAIADLASEGAALDELIDVISWVASKRRSILDELERRIEARQRFRGRRRLRAAVARLRGELSHSRTEAHGRRLVRRADARFTQRPHSVGDGRRAIAELDTAIVELRYGIDVDGPPHLLPWVAENDRQRDRKLAGHGWANDRFLWREIERDEQGFVDEVRRAVRRREKALR